METNNETARTAGTANPLTLEEKWQKATLADNFIFYKIMSENPDVCKELLEILLGKTATSSSCAWATRSGAGLLYICSRTCAGMTEGSRWVTGRTRSFSTRRSML